MQMLKLMNLNPSQDELEVDMIAGAGTWHPAVGFQNFISMVDRNGNGYLEFSEFYSMVLTLTLMAAFKKIDLDGSGKIR